MIFLALFFIVVSVVRKGKGNMLTERFVRIAHFMNMVGNCFRACAKVCGGGRGG